MAGKCGIIGIKCTGTAGIEAVDLLRAAVDVVGVRDDHIRGVLTVPVEEGTRQVDDSYSCPEEDEHEDNHQDLEGADHLWPLLANTVYSLSRTSDYRQTHSQHDPQDQALRVAAQEDAGVDVAVYG